MGILNVDNLRGVGSGTSVTCLSNRLETTNINASGIVTATKFVGPFENTGDFTVDDYVVHAGDTNTKFGFPDADTFTIETNGAERIRIGSTGVSTFTNDVSIRNTGGVSLLSLIDANNESTHEFGTPGNGDLRITVDKNDVATGPEFQLYMRGNDAADLAFHIDHDRNVKISNGRLSVGTVQTTHTLGVTGGSSSQLLVKGTEADIWMESTGPSGVWRILGSTGTNTHRFRIYDNTNGKEPFYIDGSSGTNTQHVHVNSGNLVFDAAGTGIDFSQTNSSATGVNVGGEILDHFEEGSWTPTQATLGEWASGALIDGKYQRVGHWVTASFIVKYISNGSAHAASIDGLPYANNNSGASYKQGGFVSYSNNSNCSSLLIGNGESRIYIYTNTGSTINLTNMDNVEVRGTVIYRVA